MKNISYKKINIKKAASTTFLVILVIICVLSFVGSVAVMYAKRQINFEADRIMFEAAVGNSTTKIYCNSSTNENGSTNYNWTDEALNGLPRGYVPVERAVISQGSSVWCCIADMSPHLKNAFIAIEDHRFYSHDGVDFLRTGYAAANYILKFNNRFGGSTITQQLVKNITSDNGYSVGRKIREMIRALEIEKNYSKDEILELYLNVIPLPQNRTGVYDASMCFFSKEPSELSIAEAATLAATACAPSKYDPSKYPEKAVARRNIVLGEMRENGYISDSEYNMACSEELKLNLQTKESDASVNSWYTDTVIEDVIDDLCLRLGYSREAATKLVYSGGLRIYSMEDAEIQAELEKKFNSSELSCNDLPEYSCVILDSHNGDLLGIYGGRGKKTGNRLLNYASKVKRAPGSSLKPLSVYAPALENKIINYATVIDDTPLSFLGKDDDLRPWPKNYPDVYSGLTDMRKAIALSKNTVALKVMEQLGVETSYSYLKNRFGITSLVRKSYDADGAAVTDCTEAALALGQLTDGVTLRQLCEGYTPFSSCTGIHSRSRSYCLVTDSAGKYVLKNEPSTRRAVSASNAYIMTKLLEGTVEIGTASDTKLKYAVDAAGKTGTSNYDFNRNFICYTPYCICGVWCGYPDPKEIGDQSISHIKLCDEIMLNIHNKKMSEKEIQENFSEPKGIISKEYCVDSGHIPGAYCDLDPRGTRTSGGYFTADNFPSTNCDCHRLFYRHIDNGGVLTRAAYDMLDDRYKNEFCETALIRTDRVFPKQIFITDAQYSCRDQNYIYFNTDDKKAPYFYSQLREGEYSGISPTPDMTQYNFGWVGVDNNTEKNNIIDPDIDREYFFDNEKYRKTQNKYHRLGKLFERFKPPMRRKE